MTELQVLEGASAPPWRYSVAPMMAWTDKHYRYLARLISRHTLLYTEMVTTGAILFGDAEPRLAYNAEEHPIAVQLGGSEPEDLAKTAKICESYGYDEINLNCGCPSDRVKRGAFGACLMAEPERVRDSVIAMRDVVDVPVTVKCRIGIADRKSEAAVDELSYQDLLNFIDVVAEGGCTRFIVHARKAILGGLSPAQNRQIPPLRYDVVERLKTERPELTIVLNGGLVTVDDCEQPLSWADGVMVGRAAYHNPLQLAEVDARLFGADPMPLNRHQIVHNMLPYVEQQLAAGVRLQSIARHMHGLFQSVPGAKQWRRYLSENAPRETAGVEVLEQALLKVPDITGLPAVSDTAA